MFTTVMPDDLQQTVVLIDAQNVYRSARRVFFDDQFDRPSIGQYHPYQLAEMLVARNEGRVLHSVHIFRGRSNRHIDPRGHSANVRQSQAWARAGVTSHVRELRYLAANPGPSDGEEKGVDVELAVTLVSMALREKVDVDVAIVVSADTDLVPAVLEALEHSAIHIEVAGWHNGRWGQRLRVPGRKIWCHWLDEDDYYSLADETAY